MTFVPALCSALPLPADAGAPDWVHLLPAGAIATRDGRGPFRVDDVPALMTRSLQLAGGKLALDENHATDLAAPKGGAAPARGWIVELQQRTDGVWGRVDWTGAGRRMMEDREYRGVSPVILHDKGGAVHAIARASLTNTPNLTGLTSLHSENDDMALRERLIEALGLDGGADDDAIVAAAGENGGAVTSALNAALQPIGALVGVAADAGAAAVLAGVRQLKDGAGKDEIIVGLQSELADVTTRLNAVVDGQSRERATAFVDGAIAAGRVGVKPMRDEYISMHMADPARCEKLVGAMPIVRGGASLGGTPPAAHADGLDDADRQVIALMGVDLEAYKKQRKALTQEAL